MTTLTGFSTTPFDRLPFILNPPNTPSSPKFIMDDYQPKTHTLGQKHQQKISGVVEKDQKSAMFYSQCLLSKKGPLAAIWVAGCCLKRLKKRQVTDTHIPTSVDKILLEGLPSVTYRILAYLLLGVVRIYFRKVEYLFRDCHEAVSDINRFSVGKKVVPFKDLVRSTPSIILPKRYELDAFQLEVAEGAGGEIIAQNEDIILQDAGKDTSEQYYLDKKPFDELSSHRDENCECDAPSSAGITVHHQMCPFTRTPSKVTGNSGTSMSACTPPDKVLSPYQIQIGTEVSSPDYGKNIQTSKEKLRELRFTQTEFIDVDMFCGVDVELLNLINEYELQKTVVENGNDIEEAVPKNHDHAILEDKEVPSPMEKSSKSEVANTKEFCGVDVKLLNLINEYELQKTVVEDGNDIEEAVPNNHDHAILEDKEVPSPIEKTPKSEVANTKGGTTPEFLVVATPAKKENIHRPNKRKCIIDEVTVLDNQVMKQSINDASGLVCKRKKRPHTMIDIWRFSRFPTLSKNFSEPLIPCVALEPPHVHCIERTERMEASSSTTKEIEMTQALKPLDVASPSTPGDSRSIIAPGTPVRGPTSARFFVSPRAADSEGEGPVHIYENMRKKPSVFEDEDCGPNLMDEMGANEGDSQELHKNKNGLSARTQTVARYLHGVLHKKKQQGEEAITLHPILKRKTRAETARFFFEILVLSSRGLVNVRQEKAYDDVFLQETAELEATLMNS